MNSAAVERGESEHRTMAVFERDYMRPGKPGLRLPETWTWRLIILCCAVWFVQMAARHWFRTPIDTWFGLSVSGLAKGKLWTILTYAFLHGGFGHLLWNGFGIWVFGGILERAMPRAEYARLTVWAAVAGGLGYLLGDLVMGSGGYVIGASGILSTYLALAALRFPRTPIRLLLFPFFSFPLWVLALVVFAGDILGAGSRGGTEIAYWAHIGGAAYGAVVFRCGVLPRWSLPRLRLRGGGGGGGGPPRPTRAAKKDKADRERVDALLDKINRDGIGALTEAERRFLNDASRRYH